MPQFSLIIPFVWVLEQRLCQPFLVCLDPISIVSRVSWRQTTWHFSDFTMTYIVVYDGNCNLCVSLVQLLERLDQGGLFRYVPMQDEARLQQFHITPRDCEQGMILLNPGQPEQRWQGSHAAEEIGRLLPAGAVFVAAYRSMPGLKGVGDRVYEHIRDNRYRLFGKRDSTYYSAYPDCASGDCKL
jgi:predicted DCC family thiol-disulfide oxidoreductase YuxK